MNGLLEKEPDNKKAREGFIEAARTLELTDIKELHGLAETMFKVNGKKERGGGGIRERGRGRKEIGDKLEK
jgi:hypothetical protein